MPGQPVRIGLPWQARPVNKPPALNQLPVGVARELAQARGPAEPQESPEQQTNDEARQSRAYEGPMSAYEETEQAERADRKELQR